MIRKHPEFEEYSENDIPSSPYVSGFSQNSDTVAYVKNGDYHYEIYYDIENGGYELLRFWLRNDSILKLDIIEE